MRVFFSVIIPTYNRKKYLQEAIRSALKQTYTDFEIIVVDDGSNDGTEQVIKQNFAGEEKIKYFYKANEERAVARNFGIAHARGEYCVFFDSDDLMLPEYLTILSVAIRQYMPDLVAAKYSFYDPVLERKWPSSMQNVRQGWYGLESFLKGNMLACNYAVRTASTFQLFPPDRGLASMEDWLFLLQNLVKNKIFIVDKEGVLMREHTGRSVANNNLIIHSRKKATEWAIKNIVLSVSQQRELQTYTDYFCGIHEYLEGRRWLAIRQGVKAIKGGGVKREFVLLCLKSLLGKKSIERLK